MSIVLLKSSNERKPFAGDTEPIVHVMFDPSSVHCAPDSAIILFDFAAASPSVSHDYMWDTLKFCGFLSLSLLSSAVSTTTVSTG